MPTYRCDLPDGSEFVFTPRMIEKETAYAAAYQYAHACYAAQVGVLDACITVRVRTVMDGKVSKTAESFSININPSPDMEPRMSKGINTIRKKHKERALDKQRRGIPAQWVPGGTLFERTQMAIAEAPPPVCHCGATMVKQNSKYHTGLRQRIYYRCPTPRCDTSTAAHPDGRVAATPADLETRNARIEAHGAFDALWKSGVVTREVAYAWLQRKLHVDHIGHATLEACEDIIAACKVVTPDELRGVRKEIVRAERASRPRVRHAAVDDLDLDAADAVEAKAIIEELTPDD